jgi:hypothetical protein
MKKNTTCQIYIDRVGRPNFKSAITVDYETVAQTATDLKDYIGRADSLAFPNNTLLSRFPFNITILHDDLFEYDDEYFDVQLSNVKYEGLAIGTLGAQNRTKVIIEDDGDAGDVKFNLGEYTVVEKNTSSLQVTVTRVGRDVPDGNLTVDYQLIDKTAKSGGWGTAPNNDYEPQFGTLRFDTGEKLKYFNVTVFDDDFSPVKHKVKIFQFFPCVKS